MEPPRSPDDPSPPEHSTPEFQPPSEFPAPPEFPAPAEFQSPQSPPGFQQPPGFSPPPGQPPPGFSLPPGQPPAWFPPPRRGDRAFVGIVIAAAVVFVLVCGGAVTAASLWLARDISDMAGDAVDSPAPDQMPTRDGPVRWWPQQTSTSLDTLWSDLADDFASATDGEVIFELRAFEEFQVQLEVAIAAGEPPDLFFSAGGAQLREQVRDGQLRDLTDDLADLIATLPPATLAPYTVDGRVYGLPYHMGVLGLWFNRELFAEADLDPDRPPRTWTEFESAVSDLKDAGIAPIALAGAESWTAQFWYSYLALRVAGDEGLTGAHRTRSFSDNPDLLRAAELLADLVATEPFQSGFETSPYVGPGGQAEQFASGAAAMELMGSWARDFHTLEGGDLGEDLGWFPFPAVASGDGSAADVVGTGEGFVVGAGAPDNTLELLRFLFTGETYQRIVDAYPLVIPVLPGAASADDPLVAAQREAIAQAPALRPPLDSDLPGDVGIVLADSIQALVLGRLTPVEAMSQITDAYQREPDG